MVRLTGRFEAIAAGAVRERLHAAVAAGSGRLLVDLSGVDSIDATGLGVLVGTQRLAERSGRSLALWGTPERLARLLRVTRLDRVLPTVSPTGLPAVRPVGMPGRGAGAVSCSAA